MVHRSRLGWADPMDGEPARASSPPRLPKVVRLSIIGLAAAVFLALVGVGLLATYVYQQQQYIQGKGEQRDRENAELQEQIRQSICDLLDQLPEGGLLERPRIKYDCGPGIPLEQLTPQEQAQVRARPTVPPPPPPMGSPAVPNPPRPSTGPVPPRTGPGPMSAPTPTPPPPGLLGPVPDIPLLPQP